LIEYNNAVDDCNNALKINPNYAKAYHRKAKAFIALSISVLMERK
jgi:hypothetical protein